MVFVDEVPVPSALDDALSDFEAALGGTTVAAATLLAHATAIADNTAVFGANGDLLARAFSLVETYEAVEGPLFINSATQNGFARSGGLELHRLALALQQAIIDDGFKNNNVEQFTSIIEGAAFATSTYFPGAVTSPDSATTHTVKINASQPTFVDRPVAYIESDARRPTGTYLAPGDVAVVAVPDELVNAGFSIRVGADGTAAQAALQDIIDLYFPDGRP